MTPSSVVAPINATEHTLITSNQRIPVTFDLAFQTFQSLFDSHDSLLVVANSIKNTIVATNQFSRRLCMAKKKPPANLS